jgi:hypothetical protein
MLEWLTASKPLLQYVQITSSSVGTLQITGTRAWPSASGSLLIRSRMLSNRLFGCRVETAPGTDMVAAYFADTIDVHPAAEGYWW